jgi:hypothetical protein
MIQAMKKILLYKIALSLILIICLLNLFLLISFHPVNVYITQSDPMGCNYDE